MSKTIFDGISPDSAEIIFAGSCACAADDYIDLHYHVTMAWRRRFGFDRSMAELPPARVTDLLAHGMAVAVAVAMELTDIGFHAEPKSMEAKRRTAFEKFVRANDLHEERRSVVDEIISQYHKHKGEDRMTTLYTIQRDDGSLFAGFGATHRPSAPKLLWSKILQGDPIDDADRVCLYTRQDRVALWAIADMTDGVCKWVAVHIGN